MVKIKELFHKIKRKWTKFRLQPIRVFCLHHVSVEYDPLTMWECDWMQLCEFKQKVMQMKAKGVEFISLPQAHKKLNQDWCRRKKYAVLTADDGYKSILNILPWLEEQHIPITLFINTKYLDGKSWSAINEEQTRRVKPDVDMLKDVCPNLYLTTEDLHKIVASPYVTIGMHGHEHLDATKISVEEFRQNMLLCKDALKEMPHTIPYYAYPWERHTSATDEVLCENGLIPVLVNGKNYNNNGYIRREVFDRQEFNAY